MADGSRIDAGSGLVSAAGSGGVNLSAGEDYNLGSNRAGNAEGDVTMASGRMLLADTGTIRIEATRHIWLSVGTSTGNVVLSADDDDFGLADGVGALLDNLAVTATAGSPLQYARVTPDGDVTLFGTQLTADEYGAFEFWVLRPATLTTSAATEDWTIRVSELSGQWHGTLIETDTAPQTSAPLRFDFGIAGSPVQPDFLPVTPQTTYTALRGYGWTTRVAGANRQDPHMSALRTDLNYARDATFRVDLPNGTYSVRVVHANPKYYGVTTYIVDNFRVYAEGLEQYTIANIPAGASDVRTFTVTVTDGALDIRLQDFGGLDGNFVISGIEISAGALPGAAPLQAAGDPRDAAAAAITTADLAPVVAEAAARWLATGLSAEQAAALQAIRFAVADLGGAYLGLADVASNSIRIDDDAARFGWSEVGSQRSEVGSQRSVVSGDGSRTTDKGQRTTGAVDLLTVVMHELGHLLGYDHSDDPDDLMAPVLSASQSRTARSLDLLSLSRNEETDPLRTSRRSRLERHQRELDAWFAELGEDSPLASAAAEADSHAAGR